MSLVSVTPSHRDWKPFLTMSSQYISTLWPDVLEGKSLSEFEVEYEAELKERLSEGGRGLFLLKFKNDYVGLSNAYIEGETLNIAEFYIKENCRRRGYGRQLYKEIIEWAKQNQATKLAIEVDKDLQKANQFWSSFPEHELDNSGERNIYRKDTL